MRMKTTSSPVAPGSRGLGENFVKRLIHLAAAAIFFVIGVLGAILPVLPATPFLLLTSYFLVRSSPRLNDRLLNSRFVGPVLKDWQVQGGVRPDVKVRAIVIVVVMLSLSIWVTDLSWPVSVGIVALALVGIGVILRLPSV